jgi:hypothetical protein
MSIYVDLDRLADELRAKHFGVAINIDAVCLADELRADHLG